jgi:hypothetical protein
MLKMDKLVLKSLKKLNLINCHRNKVFLTKLEQENG